VLFSAALELSDGTTKCQPEVHYGAVLGWNCPVGPPEGSSEFWLGDVV
jgi:hypothetical protein